MKKLFCCLFLLVFIAGCGNSPNGELIFVKAGDKNNFHFPYFLFIPNNATPNEKTFIIVEPNNSGFVDDDFSKHVEKAERTASKDYYLGNYIARKLKIPLIVPVFHRSKSEWKIYTHALDRDVMLQKNNPLERIDLQLIAMFNDARLRLKNYNILTNEQFLLTGFSASGTFANRFTLMHPEKIRATAAGGLNGLLMLPLDTLQQETLNFPIGISDLEKITNTSFQKEEFLNTPQFYFMGELDNNDAIPYDDAYNLTEREQIFRLFGEQMLPERWENCKKHYQNYNVNAIIKSYKNVGHQHPEYLKDEIVEFLEQNIKFH